MKVQPVRTALHPLSQLSGEEIEATAAILRSEGRLGEQVRIHGMGLKELAKAAVLAFELGQPFDREVEVVLRDRERRLTCEAVVSLTEGVVTSWVERNDVQPPLTIPELLECESTIKADPRWQEAMRRRGVEAFELAMIDPWPLGNNGPDDDPEKGRKVIGLTWMRRDEEDNGYARPVENLIVHFDLDETRVIRVEDHGVVPIPPRAANYSTASLTDPDNYPVFPEGPRQDLKPIDIVQREGTSFTVEDNQVEWQKWRFRIGFTQREGLVLHTISYRDQDRWRPIVYRASLSEMYIPYGDPSPQQYRKNVFDMGEFGLGIWTNQLELGCDCLGEIRYFDAFICDDQGRPVKIVNAVCMHEEDAGLLWKHHDFRSGGTEMRRSRRLVVSSICTVGNYEYGFYWYLYQDGTIEYEVKLSGVVSNGAVADGERPLHGVLVAPGVYAPNHQHFFNVRLDMTVDGERNSVYEVDSVADEPGAENPNGNCWRARQTLLGRESDAQRRVDQLAARYWRIENPTSQNALGDAVAYKLQPGDNTGAFFQPGAPGLARAGFAASHLWVTAHDPSQMHAAGQYPNQSPGGDGLPRYVQADRELENGDLVVWYTFGAHHVPRPEDWPVMPVVRVGFQLKPVGFFDANPALDLPAPHCHTASAASQEYSK
jgi:primary-amine oxidase